MDKTPNKIQIPGKTRIAVKIMTIYSSILFLILFMVAFFSWELGMQEIITARMFDYIWAFFMLLLYFMSARMLLGGIYLSWNLAVFLLTIMAIGSLVQTFIGSISYVFGFLGNTIPLSLLLLDRKNYFAEIEKAKKKN